MDAAYEQLANRFRRVHRHLRKWAKRTDVSCYRLYDRDIADQPLIVDWYDGDAVVWAHARTRNETPEQEREWLARVLEAVGAGLDLPSERIFLKRRAPQKDRQSGEGQYEKLDQRRAVKTVREQGLLFEVNLSDYLDTGLFLDHRPTRALVREGSAGKSVLNLFAYTGSFTCYARAGGAAATTTVDLSNTYLDWARRNLAHNGLAESPEHTLVKADCLEWLANAPSAPQRWDLIICDPPTFSNSTSMQRPFSVEKDHPWLLAQCHALLRDGGAVYFSTNFRGFELSTVMPPFTIEDLTDRSIPEDFRNKRIHRCWRLTKR
ncbi:MAG: class I SAM-dependent methyltransferase [Planctomycetes bacterium]|nr:class I SAM-dependent methyltransferase [Planctomycetota bacterium]